VKMSDNSACADAAWEQVKQFKKKKHRFVDGVATTKAAAAFEPLWLLNISSRALGASSCVVSSEPFILLLAGLPGSGKSTFSKKLEELLPNQFVRINQDDLGDRHRCLSAATSALQAGKSPVIDRCNQDHSQRNHWIELARSFNCPIDCIVLDVPPHVCLARCQRRRNHPTITPQPPDMANAVVNRLAQEFVWPTKKEGYRNFWQAADDLGMENAFISYLPDSQGK